MTTPSEAEQLIYARFLDQWGSTTPVALEEEQVPAGVSVGETAWVYVYVQEIERQQLSHGSIGSRKFLQKSQVVIRIYVPQGAGTQLATNLAQQARTIFEGVRLDPLQNFYKADIERVGPQPPEYIVAVICPFEYVEMK